MVSLAAVGVLSTVLAGFAAQPAKGGRKSRRAGARRLRRPLQLEQGDTAVAGRGSEGGCGAFDDKVTETAYTTKPTWYIVAKADRMIPPDAERAMAKAANAKITELDSTHVVMLSKPKQVADVILAAAAAVKN